MANRQRGEISARLGDGEYTLCLTLGALAELESALRGSDLAALAARFEDGRFSARDLIAIIGAGLRGAGHAIPDAEVASMTTPGGVAGYVAVVSDLLTATFACGDETPHAKKNG